MAARAEIRAPEQQRHADDFEHWQQRHTHRVEIFFDRAVIGSRHELPASHDPLVAGNTHERLAQSYQTGHEEGSKVAP